jgi:hypothetical protein
MSVLSRIRALFGGPDEVPRVTDPEPPSRHDRREAGRERHHATGEPAWEASDRIEEPPGAGQRADDAPEILGGS